jgi:hypothetical protein
MVHKYTTYFATCALPLISLVNLSTQPKSKGIFVYLQHLKPFHIILSAAQDSVQGNDTTPARLQPTFLRTLTLPFVDTYKQ